MSSIGLLDIIKTLTQGVVLFPVWVSSAKCVTFNV